MSRTFILSPAHCGGLRARMILADRAGFDLARRLRSEGARLGEVFSFLSGLYFRGKLTYARAFADPVSPCPGVLVITPCRGLLAPDTLITADDLRLFATTDIHTQSLAYVRPLVRDIWCLAMAGHERGEVILLGSIASEKYVKVLLRHFRSRLLFPRDFVGRGDMSRGGLLLRHAEEGQELDYIPVEGAIRHGKRPPKLAPRR